MCKKTEKNVKIYSFALKQEKICKKCGKPFISSKYSKIIRYCDDCRTYKRVTAEETIVCKKCGKSFKVYRNKGCKRKYCDVCQTCIKPSCTKCKEEFNSLIESLKEDIEKGVIDSNMLEIEKQSSYDKGYDEGYLTGYLV